MLDLVRIGLDRVVAFVPTAALSEHPELRSIDVIDMAELSRRIEGDGAQPLDVRRATEFAEGHVPGALNVAHTRLRVREAEVPTGETWFVYCRTGARAAAATALLARGGHDVVYVDDEIANWKAKEEPAAV